MTENTESVITTEEEVVAQLTEDLQESQLAESLNQESVEAAADTAQAIPEDEQKESVGLDNLRNPVGSERHV